MSSVKIEKIENGLRKAINSFLSKNSDRVGFCHVQEIAIANDLRSARVYIEFIDTSNLKESLGFINKSHRDILKEYNKLYSSKVFPSIRFYSFNHAYNI